MTENNSYRVELLFNTQGQNPEHRVEKIVSAKSDEGAVHVARSLVVVEDLHLNNIQIDTWVVTRIHNETTRS